MGEQIFCGNCANQTLLTSPNVFGNGSIEWINLSEQGIPAVCPSCRIIYSVAKVISNLTPYSC